MPYQLGCCRHTGFHIFYKIGQIRSVSVVKSRLPACLLQAHIVPLLVLQGIFKRIVLCFHFLSVCSDFSVIVLGLVLFGIVIMPFKRAPADIHIPDDGRVALFRSQFVQILLHCILREAVSDSQNLYHLIAGG